MLPGPRSRCARVHARPCQGCKPCPRTIAASGLVLATQEAGNVTGQATDRDSGFRCRGGPPRRHSVAVLLAEAPGQIFGQRVAVALPVGGAHEGCDDVEVPVLDLAGLAPEIGEAKVDIELQQVDAARALRHGKSLEGKSDDIGAPLALAGWERSISGRPDCPLARAPQRRSRYCRC